MRLTHSCAMSVKLIHTKLLREAHSQLRYECEAHSHLGYCCEAHSQLRYGCNAHLHFRIGGVGFYT